MLHGYDCVVVVVMWYGVVWCVVWWCDVVWYYMTWHGILFIVCYVSQLVDLLTSGDWSTYMADHGKSYSKYSRVSPSVAAKLLEK